MNPKDLFNGLIALKSTLHDWNAVLTAINTASALSTSTQSVLISDL